MVIPAFQDFILSESKVFRLMIAKKYFLLCNDISQILSQGCFSIEFIRIPVHVKLLQYKMLHHQNGILAQSFKDLQSPLASLQHGD